jgi:lipoyl(octanoyl) transferase
MIRDLSTSLDMTTMVFATLDVYDSLAPHSAAMNMAIDEALLERAVVPSIRFYHWQSPAVSFGYFGRFSNVAIHAGDRDVVRRWTGGGIVFHGEDLTYSIVIPASDPAFRESSMTIYERIHGALAHAIGARASVAGGVDPGGSAVAKQTAVEASGYNCFANAVRADVMIDGRKVAGAAQRRTRRGLLQQGSIQSVALESDLAPRFARALSQDCGEFKISKEILKRAGELAQQKYGTDSWLRKR